MGSVYYTSEPNRLSWEDSSLAMSNIYEPNMYYYPAFRTQLKYCAGDWKMEILSMHSTFLEGRVSSCTLEVWNLQLLSQVVLHCT